MVHHRYHMPPPRHFQPRSYLFQEIQQQSRWGPIGGPIGVFGQTPPPTSPQTQRPSDATPVRLIAVARASMRIISSSHLASRTDISTRVLWFIPHRQPGPLIATTLPWLLQKQEDGGLSMKTVGDLVGLLHPNCLPGVIMGKPT